MIAHANETDTERGPIPVERHAEVREQLRRLRDQLGNWKQVADLLDVSPSYLSRVIREQSAPGRTMLNALQSLDTNPQKVLDLEHVPNTVPELLQEIRRLLHKSITVLDQYAAHHDPSPFARGGLEALREKLLEARDGATI